MASALNKRQQARNERALQELIKTVPGNSVCADCGARNPGWASWSLGIFLCMRCAALHRKLGTHISKVKSLSMDKWDNAQVDNMKRIGNVESNKLYNPRNLKAQIPIDIDEVDSAMERYIRQKYEQRIFLHDSRPGTRSNTGSTSSAEDRPPPLPPKPTKRFGFGIQKSSTHSKNTTPPVSPGLGTFNGQDASPPRVNKPSRVFGSNVHTSGDGLDSKLATLRDMGFPDEKRNSTVLKGLNGNLDKTVEALIRLGEQNPDRSRGNTPTPPAKPSVNGLSIGRTQTAPASTMNPFDALDAVAPVPQQQASVAPIQTQQMSYGTQSQPISPSNPFNAYMSQAQGAQYQPQQQNFTQQHNPFGQQQQPQSLEQSLQGLQLSNQQQSQQPLFPNRTGGYNQHQSPAPFAQTNPFQHSFTPPPMPQMPPQYGSFYQSQEQQHQSLSNPTSPGNPFLKSTRSQMFTPTSSFSSNPFGQFSGPHQQQPQQQQYQAAQQPQQQQPQHQYQAPQQPQQQQPQHQYQAPQQPQQQHQQQQYQALQQSASNPFLTQQQPQIQNSSVQAPTFAQTQQPAYQQSTYPQPQGPFNKNSILALYNYPQLAPQRAEQAQTPPVPAQPSAPAAPATGSMNPFAGVQGGQGSRQAPTSLSAQDPTPRHVSNESVDFAGLMGGRHSPDAFSGLSSSFRR